MNRLFASVLVVLVSLSGCTLRPRYKDLVTADVTAKTLKLQVVERYGANAPIPGAKVECGEGKNKVSVVTGEDGTFEVPVTSGLSTDNPVFVVTLPPPHTQYRLELAPLKVLAPAPVEAPPTGNLVPMGTEPAQSPVIEPNRVVKDDLVKNGEKAP